MEVFDRAADLIHRAKNRDFYGVGGSAQIARDVSHKFLRIGVRASVFDDSYMMLMSASLLVDGDIAIGFSHSGNTTAVIEAIQLAWRNGARTIAITNYNSSALVQAVDVGALFHGARFSLMGENAAARLRSSTSLMPCSLPLPSVTTKLPNAISSEPCPPSRPKRKDRLP
ncbi:SIS domain-containing protein [Rhizobium beringeri]